MAAFTAARNAECVAILHHHGSPEAAFLRTRALIRLSRLNDAERVIRNVQPRSGYPCDLAQCYTLLGTVLDRQGDYDGANDAFNDARAYAYSIPSVALHAELGLYEAHSAWRHRDLEQTERIALHVLNEMPRAYDEPHSYALGVSHAFLYELLVLVWGVREQHATQIAFLERGLGALPDDSVRHVWAEASLLRNFAALVPELRFPSAAATLREHAESLQWTPETAKWGYDVYRALGWSAALDGDYVGAFRNMREAHNLAPCIPWRIESVLDRAYLFDQIGDIHAALERFDEAEQLLKRVDYSNWSHGEERYVLLWAAQIAAPLNASRASALLAHYKTIRKPMDPALLWGTHSRQWHAHEHDTYGAVAAANGESSIALNHLRGALQTWDALKFEWRAAKTANAIARITNSNEDIAGARRRAEPFAKSWLARN